MSEPTMPNANAAVPTNITVADQSLSSDTMPNSSFAGVTGFFDAVDGMEVIGWCFDQQNPGHTMDVEVLCEDALVARGRADIFREDLAKAGIGKGYHQFRIKLPKRLADGLPHSLTAREAVSKKLLNSGPKILQSAPGVASPQPRDAKQAGNLLAQAEVKRTEKLWVEAEALAKKSISLDSTVAKAYFLLAQVIEKIGRQWEAADAYNKAIELDPRHASWHYSYGLILEKRDELQLAADAYRKSIELRGDISARHYRLGHVLAQLGEHEDADMAFIYSMELDTTGTSKRFGIGTYHAERGLWSEAAKAFEQFEPAAADRAELLYRSGIAYEQSYNWPAAIGAYQNAIALDATNPEWHYRLGTTLERAQDWSGAADAYQAAVLRKEVNEPKWHYRLGFALSRAGVDASACDAFRQAQPIQKTYGLDDGKYDSDKGFKLISEYTEYFKSLPLTDKTIMYESFHGSSMSCNPYAIFLALQESPEYADWTHIWVLNDKTRVPDRLKSKTNIVFVSRGCDLYLRYLTTTKYLINNTTFPEYFIRKPEQVYLNTWHGTPWKTLGKDNLGQFFEHKNSTRNFLHATHMISPNAYTTNVLIDRYDIRGVYQGLMVETGYPRVDLTLNMQDDKQGAVRKKLGLSRDEKVILYAPTWRGTHGVVNFNIDRLVLDLNHMNDMGGTVLFRGHHMVEKLLKDTNLGTRIVPSDLDTNELLGIVDVLITDYSSIFFDFIPSDKPIIHYVYDYEQYAKERGLYLPIEDMPGQVCKDIIGVKLAVRRLIGTDWHPTQRHLTAKERFCPRDDGSATTRVIDLVFKGIYDKNAAASDNIKPILFFAGPFMPNGITTSFINLCKNIDKTRFRPVVILDPKNMGGTTDRLEQFGKVKDEIQALGRAGRMNITAEERRLIDEFIFNYDLPTDEAWNTCAEAYEREFIRMFGYTKFESIVNFEGYSQFWAAVMAFAPATSAKSKSIYLHNDMHGEWRVRFSYLESVLRIYNRHDTLISVTESINNENIKNLSDEFNIPASKFKYCDNTLLPATIRAQAMAQLPNNVPGWLGDTNCKVFISMGRLSKEKDHRKLLEAFAEIHHIYPQTRLMIIGEGPLRYELECQISDLQIRDVAVLAGQHVNPFPMLKAADCFVLSSNHEGQGMVLLESLTLEVPTMSTNIPGPQSVLAGRSGLLVENSVGGLVSGMHKFMDGELIFKDFDAEEYQRKAIEMFYKNVCQED